MKSFFLVTSVSAKPALVSKPIAGTQIDTTGSFAEGLVSYWPFFEGTGHRIQDMGVYKNHGTLAIDGSGAYPVWVGSSLGKVLYFDGSKAKVDVPDDPSLDIINDITIVAWINPDSVTGSYKTIISKEETSGVDLYVFQFSLVQTTGALFYFHRREGAAQDAKTSTDTVTLNVWTQIALTVKNDVLTFYINGVPDSGGTQALGQARGPNAGLTYIGTNRTTSSTQLFSGLISSIAVWNRALSANEIAFIADNRLAMFKVHKMWQYIVSAVTRRLIFFR
jgi:hypothetical protein